VEAGQDLTVTLHWDSPPEGAGEVEIGLAPQAGFVFGEAEVLASVRAPLNEPETSLTLKVPGEVNPGPYLLRVSVRDPEGAVRPLGPRGQPLSFVYVGPVRVEGTHEVTAARPLRELGQGIELLQVAPHQEGGTLLAETSWHTRKALSLNYLLSLRLKHPAGQVLGIKDAQPHHGLFPTSFWRPGEVVLDRRRLELPPGTPPGDDYSLEVLLYDAQSLQPIGAAAHIPGIEVSEPAISPQAPVLHPFCDRVALSALAQGSVRQGEKLRLQTLWKAIGAPTREHGIRIELRDAGGAIVHSQEEGFSYPPPRWPKDSIMREWHEVPIGRDLPPGEYRLSLALLEAETGQPCGEPYTGPPLTILLQERSFTLPPVEREVGGEFGGELRLLGYDLARKGGELEMTLHWQAMRDPSQDYTVFVHLFDPRSEVIAAQHDAMPREGQYPTSRWQEGEVVSDSLSLSLEGVSAGSYLLAVGLYEREGLTRLAASAPSPSAVSHDRLILEEIILD
jgi:hypothetical protein